MKVLAAILIPGLAGFLVGGGWGYSTVAARSKDTGIVVGACYVVDSAVGAKVLTPDQAEKLGTALAQKVNAKEAGHSIKNATDVGEGCRRAFKGILQAAK